MAVSRALIDVTPLSGPAFRRLWIGRSVSGVGSQMAVVAVMFQVWQRTHSTVWTGAVGLAQAVPVIALGLFAGAHVDRVDRRRLYLMTTTGQAACSLLLAVQGVFGHVPVIGVLALIATQGGFGATGGPAARTFIPRLLPPDQVAAGLALDRLAFQASLLVGPALGGLTIAAVGVSGCYLIDAVTFGVGCYGAFGLPPMSPQGGTARPGARAVLDGLSFLMRSAPVRAALLTDLATTVLSDRGFLEVTDAEHPSQHLLEQSGVGRFGGRILPLLPGRGRALHSLCLLLGRPRHRDTRNMTFASNSGSSS